MTPQQTQDLLISLLQWRSGQGPLVDGSEIERVVPMGTGRVVVTAGDFRHVVSVKTYPRLLEAEAEK